MINNVLLTDKFSYEYETFSNKKDKIIFESNEDSNYIIEVNEREPFVQYTKYELRHTKYLEESSLNLSKQDKTIRFISGDNILNIDDYYKMHNDFFINEITFENTSISNLVNKKNYIGNDFSYNMNNSLISYCCNSFIQLEKYKMIVNLSNHVSFNYRSWNKVENVYIFNDEVAFLVIVKMKDLVQFLNNYIHTNLHLEQFINNDIIQHNKTLGEYYVNNSFDELLLYLQTKLKDDFNIIKDKIKIYSMPIRQNEFLDIYIDDFFDSSYKLKTFIKNKSVDDDTLKHNEDLLKRESCSIMKYEKGSSLINIYTGELLSSSHKLQYMDNSGIILKLDKNNIYNERRFFIKSENNIWIEAYKNECKEIYDRFLVTQQLNF